MIKAVYMKELRQYFHSMIAYVFLTILLFLSGFIFLTANLMSLDGDINSFFTPLFTILLFVTPILTMRQFAEEQKLKTRQLLFTLPLSLESIVLGKFLATLTVVGIGLAVTLLYPAVLAWYGSFSFMVTLGNYLGAVLLVAAIASLGLFLSTLTENQVVSAIASYGVILILWLVDSLAPYTNSVPVKRLISLFSLKSNYIEFTYGIFNPASILYFISLTALFLILTTVSLDSRRQ
ncbi:MAG: ABC transporter permease subunit [Spirochaetales bacterium]|nr:ABC transporter permease subunit [Spirochaetales bacterium]